MNQPGGFGSGYGPPGTGRGDYQQPFPIAVGRPTPIKKERGETPVFQMPSWPMGSKTFDLDIQIFDGQKHLPTAATVKDSVEPGWVWFKHLSFRLEWSTGQIGMGAAFAELDFQSAGIGLPVSASAVNLICVNEMDPAAPPTDNQDLSVSVMLGHAHGARVVCIPRRTKFYGVVAKGAQGVVNAVPRCATRATVKMFDFPGANPVWADEFDFSGTRVGGFPVWPQVSPWPIALSHATSFIRLRNDPANVGNADVAMSITYDLSF